MAFSPPTIDTFKAQFDRDFRFGQPGFGALVSFTLAAGAITMIGPAAGGGGQAYQQSPQVPALVITDAKGSGASAVPVFTAGVFTGSTALVGGSNYVAPTIVLTGGGDQTNLRVVRDADIQKAIAAALIVSNPDLWADQDEWNYVMGLKSAHYLVTNLKASSQGVSGQGDWLVNAKSAADISASYTIPERILKSPGLSLLSKTQYGMEYLSLISPRLVGNLMAIPRRASAA